MSQENQIRQRLRANAREFKRATDPAARERIREQMRQDRDMLNSIRQGVDFETGISPRQRAQLGAAQTPEEEMAYLRGQFPLGVVSTPQGYQVIPEEGAPLTAVNPGGLDIGDVTALADPAIRTAAGTVGAIAGAAGGPVGSIAGAGAGEAVGGQISNELLRPEYRPSIGQRAQDVVVDFGMGSAGEGIGQVIGSGLRWLKNRMVGGPEEAAELAQAYQRQEIPPASRAALIPNAINRSLHGALEQNILTGGGPMRMAQDATDEAFSRRMSILTNLQDRESAGDAARAALETYASARRAAEGEPFQQFSEAMRENPVPLTRTVPFVRQNEAQVAEPVLGAVAYQNPVLTRMAGDLPEDGSIPEASWDTVQAARGQVRPESSGLAGRPAGEISMSRLYRNLTQDAEAALQAQGLGENYQAARNAYRLMKNELKRLDKDFPETMQPEVMVNKIISTARTSPSRLAEIRTAIEGGDPNAWTMIQNAILHDMSQATPGKRTSQGGPASLETFVTNLNRLGSGTDRERAMDVLFGESGPVRENVNDLMMIAETNREAREFINASRTGSNLALGTLVGGGLSGVTSGAGLATAAAPLLAANASALWLTRPGFVREAAEAATRGPGALAAFRRGLTQAAAAGSRDTLVEPSPWEEQQQGPDWR